MNEEQKKPGPFLEHLIKIVKPHRLASPHEAVEIVNVPGRVWIAFMLDPPRPGARLWMRKVELVYFPPREKEQNRLLDIMAVEWNEMVYGILMIPAPFLEAARFEARHLGMRINDGYPVVYHSSLNPKLTIIAATRTPEKFLDLSLTSFKKFIFSTPNTYTLENDQKANKIFGKQVSRSYHVESLRDQLLAREDKMIEQLEAELGYTTESRAARSGDGSAQPEKEQTDAGNQNQNDQR